MHALMSSPRSHSLTRRLMLLLASLCLPQAVSAATYTWVPTASGTTYDWNNTANWTPSTAFPNAVDDIVNITNNIAGAQTIRLNVPVTVGTLNLGDSTSTYYAVTLAAGTAGSLIFQDSSGTATLARTTNTSAVDVISADVLLNSSLLVSLSTGSSNGIRISGLISGANGIELGVSAVPTGSSAQYLDLINTNNSYTGDTIISNGVLIFRGSVLSGQNSALGNATSAIKIGSSNSQIGANLQNGTNAQLRLQASSDTEDYVIERGLDFSGNTGTAAENGRARFALDGDGTGGVNTNTLTISGTVTLSSNGRGTEFLATRQGQTIRFTGQILSGTGSAGTIYWGPASPGTGTDGRMNGTIRFSDLARTYTNAQNLTGGTIVIEGSVGAVGTASPIGTQTLSLGDGNGGNILSANTLGANRRLFMETPGTTFARSLSPSGGTSTVLASASTAIQALYGNSGNMNLMNGYEFGGLNTSGTVTFSGNIAAQNLNVAVTGTAGGAGGTNVVTIVHNFALTAATGGTTVFSGVISGSTVPTAGSTTAGATAAANNTRITINQFRNHPNLDTNQDGIPDPGLANALVGTATEGTVVLSGANTYGGGTEVLGGTLLVNNTSGSGTGTGAVVVTSGVLGGTGSITTTSGVQVTSAGTIRPGDASVSGGLGVLTLTAPLTLNQGGGSSTLDFQISRTTSDVNASSLIANLNPNGTMNWEAISANTGGLYAKDSAINNDTLTVNGSLTIESGTSIVKISSATGSGPLTYSAGMVWDLMDWTTLVNVNSGSYSFEIDSALQSALDANGLMLDTSRFWDTGYVGIINAVMVPEPSRLLLVLAGLMMVGMRRCRMA